MYLLFSNDWLRVSVGSFFATRREFPSVRFFEFRPSPSLPPPFRARSGATPGRPMDCEPVNHRHHSAPISEGPKAIKSMVPEWETTRQIDPKKREVAPRTRSEVIDLMTISTQKKAALSDLMNGFRFIWLPDPGSNQGPID